MSIASVNEASPDARAAQALRVMLVDDSAVIRGILSRWIAREPDMEVAASLRTGRDAVSQIARVAPDVVILDIEMPDLDGLSALPELLARKPGVAVIMASTLTRRNAEISLKALSLGASDYVPKPDSSRDPDAAEAFRYELVQKIRHLGARARGASTLVASPPLAPRSGVAVPRTIQRSAAVPATLRSFGPRLPRALLVGASTGGPQALATLIAGIVPLADRVPVLITQHMPPTFTTILAEHMSRWSRHPAREAVDGEPITAGRIYLAPGSRHMRVARRGATVAIMLDDAPAINFCKPAVDPMFATAAQAWGGDVVGVVLTGMGSDGMKGAREIVDAGGSIVAQDETSSVVWGMPGAVVHAGLCAAVLPIDAIAPRLNRLFGGERS